mgnify:FL=1
MNNYVKNLPAYLVKRYKGWKATGFEENKSWFARMADVGQSPRVMVISCCDSRVHATSMFGADTGEFFIHRNIANLVPPYKPDGDHHGTSAAIEYGVTSLEVSHLIVLGHSNCGGINGGFHLCKGSSNQQESIFVHKWLSILKPAYNNILKEGTDVSQIKALEKESIKISINNLIDFPFIKKALDREKLVIHGLWHDIGSGELEMLDSSQLHFTKI